MAFVYAIMVDGVIRYIGKGTTLRRPLYHVKAASAINAKRAIGLKVKALKFHNRLAKALREGAKIEHIILVEGLSDKRAFAREVIEISTRRGLWNEDAGGKGVSSNLRKTLWRDDPTYREKMLEHNKRICVLPRECGGAAITAYNKSDIGRRRVSEVSKQRWADPEYKRRLSAALSKGWQRRKQGYGE